MTVFLIPEKIFLKIKSLMCALRAHINQILLYITFYIYIYIYIYLLIYIYIIKKKSQIKHADDFPYIKKIKKSN